MVRVHYVIRKETVHEHVFEFEEVNVILRKQQQ